MLQHDYFWDIFYLFLYMLLKIFPFPENLYVNIECSDVHAKKFFRFFLTFHFLFFYNRFYGSQATTSRYVFMLLTQITPG
jgi:hypothetical protein